MGHRPMTFDEERFSINTAFIKKGGEHFEVVIDPDAAIAFKQTGQGNVHEIVKSGHVFFDAKKGELASEQYMKTVFGSTDPYFVAERIIRDGEIQLTKEHRDKLREQKRNRVMSIIHRNAIDPRTKLPHPMTRIELAFEEAKIKLDEFKKAEDQVQDIVKKLQPILPIKFEQKLLQVHIPGQYAAKLYQTVSGYGTIKKQDWLNDGSWAGELELPAGLVNECIDALNSKTHGNVQITQL
jgi:ribosome maturation protein SDO1